MLPDLFRAATANHRSKIAVVDVSRRITYDELWEAASAFASGLQEAGARAGDRVALTLPNGVDAAIALAGVLEAGCVIVPLHAGLKGNALDQALNDADPHWLVKSSGAITKGGARGDSDSEGLAAILYTSGSSGEPKGVMLTPTNMVAAIGMVNGYLGLTADDVIYSALPLSSSYGLYQLLLGWNVGATVVLDQSFAFPASSLSFAARERATVMPAVPTLLAWMARTPLLERFNPSSLRIITSAAAALPPAHGLRLRERLPNAQLYVMYGQTECKRISWLHPSDYSLHADSVGTGLAGQEHRVVDDTGCQVPAGELGELIVRGPHVMRGYWRRPVETAVKLRSLPNEQLPWMHTGDLFTTDAEGFLHFSGRSDEILKIGGHKVSPSEIEFELCRISGVVEAAVIGIPDDHWGQVASAHLVKTPGSMLSEEDVKRHCMQHLPGYKVPREIRFESQLPKTISGKVLKRAISTPGRY